ncbi:MAG: hypothetical protein ACR2P8_02045 [Myxococcota bacterium]
MSDGACVVSTPIIGEVRARGLDLDALVGGLGIGLVHLEDPRRRMPWRTFVEFAGRATKLLGDDTIEDLAASATVDLVPAPIRRVLPRLADSRPLFMLAPRWWGPWVFHGTRGTCEKLPDGRLREIVRILPEYAACPAFLEGLRGTLRAMPRLLNQPDALVTLDHDGREGEFLITPPPRRTRFGRSWFGGGLARRAGRQIARAARALEELGFAREQLLESQRSLEALSGRLDDQSHRFEALQALGLTLVRNDDSDLETLQRELVGLLRRQTGMAGVRISRVLPSSDRTHQAVAGAVAGRSDRELPLRIADREIGLLEVWRGGEREVPAWLETLLPWIAISLEYGGSKALAAHLTRLLSNDVLDWERMEQRVDQVLKKLGVARASAAEGRVGSATDRGAFDLARFLADLAPRLRELAGDDVRFELDCPERLWPTLFDEREIRSFLQDVVEILGDMDSEEIRIETRVLVDEGSAAFGRTRAEVRIEGAGGRLDPISRSRIRAVVELCDTSVLVADLDLRVDEDGHVCVSLCLPMLTSEAGLLRH